MLLALVLAVCDFDFGLEPVETSAWGGLLVTLVVAVTGIVVSLPLGILLASVEPDLLPAGTLPPMLEPIVIGLEATLKPGDVLLLENLRFHAEEEANDQGYARQLAGLEQNFSSGAGRRRGTDLREGSMAGKARFMMGQAAQATRKTPRRTGSRAAKARQSVRGPSHEGPGPVVASD